MTAMLMANPAYRQILFPGQYAFLTRLRESEDGLSTQRRVRALVTYLAQHPELQDEIRRLAIRDGDIDDEVT